MVEGSGLKQICVFNKHFPVKGGGVRYYIEQCDVCFSSTDNVS